MFFKIRTVYYKTSCTMYVFFEEYLAVFILQYSSIVLEIKTVTKLKIDHIN